ncbi:putative membrane protein [Nostoc sp. PCC 7524]|uniref:COG3650 family protein n=1 Tax=Nostoc sp. (strain ATCC 29411 / PCC 7524) TaxID=28072 RepID=UPI00029F1C73|nr:hypothetical protein [Nostoc sp. PCC 7524]AFY50046.1 putative membrane protein [Nostoc sp. PCC 7524]
MKKLIVPILLLGISTNLLASSPSTANQSHSLVAQSNSRNRNTEEFTVSGTEPFWSVTVSKKGIIYSTPESRQSFPYVAPLTASGRPVDLVRVYRLRGRNNTNNTLVIKKVNSCSDGMSDIKYPYSAIFIVGNKVLEGCARLK